MCSLVPNTTGKICAGFASTGGCFKVLSEVSLTQEALHLCLEGEKCSKIALIRQRLLNCWGISFHASSEGLNSWQRQGLYG